MQTFEEIEGKLDAFVVQVVPLPQKLALGVGLQRASDARKCLEASLGQQRAECFH
jgi:hypothetical protein